MNLIIERAKAGPIGTRYLSTTVMEYLESQKSFLEAHAEKHGSDLRVKLSKDKTSKELACVPVNCQQHSWEHATVRHTVTTFGAPTAHNFGFKKGGLLKMEERDEKGKDHYIMRFFSCLSQLLVAVATALAKQISDAESNGSLN